jgi:hypothetical protein
MSDIKSFYRFGYDDLGITSDTNMRNRESILFYSEYSISVPANSTVVKSIPGIFTDVTSASSSLVGGNMSLIATSDFLGTIKMSQYGYLTLTSPTVFYNALGSLYGNVSSELANSTSGGYNISAVINGANLDITLDYTDGASAVTDGTLFIYMNRQ